MSAAGDELLDGRYRLDRLIGEGGMGKVFAATHVGIGHRCAIKLLKADASANPEVAQRFLREARAAGLLDSDHVCRVTDVGSLPTGEPYMVMELLDGVDLHAELRRTGPSVGLAASYVVQACKGLAPAHARGMVHRDLKPANLMLVTSNGRPCVKVLDFGISKAARDEADHSLTATQTVMGSPGYMSPEQLRSAKDVDARSDVWSLGICLYELASGRLPFREDTFSALAVAIATEPHASLAGVPPGFASIVDRCLAKKRDDRFGSVEELAAALAPYVGAGGDARPPPDATAAAAAPTPQPIATVARTLSVPAQRRWTRAIVVVAILGAVGFVVALATLHDDRPPQAKGDSLGKGALARWRKEAVRDNPWVPVGESTLEAQRHQVTVGELRAYDRYLQDSGSGHAGATIAGSGDPPATATRISVASARAYCAALDARLPTTEDWRLQAGSGSGMGPQREWVEQRRDATHPGLCGGYSGIGASDETELRDLQWCTFTTADDNDEDLLAHAGVRCVRDRRD